MNTERLLELVNVLLRHDQKKNIQKTLATLQNQITNLANNPQDSATQVAVSEQIEKLRTDLAELESKYTPAFLKRMDEIEARPYFTTALVERVSASLIANAMTPAVVQTEIGEISSERNKLLSDLKSTQDSLKELGFAEDGLDVGEAEIGFQIPRNLFSNELPEFTSELNQLTFVIRGFSEASGNAGEPIELRTMSTSDPIIFLKLGLETIKLLGRAISWGLSQWEKVAKIKSVRDQAAGLSDTDNGESKEIDEVLAHFEKLIEKTVKEEVRREAARIAAEAEIGDAGRERELATHLGKSLEWIMAKVERGVTAEIRLSPPPPAEEEELDGNEERPQAGEHQQLFMELQEIQKQLHFPDPSGDPLLQLPRIDLDEDESEETTGGEAG